jgi:hypothetical protein
MYVLVYIHTSSMHLCICMDVCAPCPPRYDPPLTTTMEQVECTDLHTAAAKGRKEKVLAMLLAGADVDAKSKVWGILLSRMSRTLTVV